MIPAANQGPDCSALQGVLLPGALEGNLLKPPVPLTSPEPLDRLEEGAQTRISEEEDGEEQVAQCDLRMVNLDAESGDELAQERSLRTSARLMYGDLQRVQAAAIIIQKAYREYRIWKRFRVITEKLRLTNNSRSPADDTTETTKTNTRDKDTKRPNDESDDSDHGSGNSSCQSTSDKDSSSSNSSTDSIPFASGATRAAICESLSQAAKYLAASAAAAKAKRQLEENQQTNEVSKFVSCEQVGTKLTNDSTATTATPTITTAATITTTRPNNPSDNKTNSPTSIPRPQQLRSDSIIPTALNLQQLEAIRKRQYRVGVNIFNKNPEKGISFLIAYAFIDCSPPYVKTSTSYYLSNQLHFNDKQRLNGPYQTIQLPRSDTKESVAIPKKLKETLSIKANGQSGCRLCFEEENLKRNVAHFLLFRKGLAKEKIGEYLGNLQSQFVQDVLVFYLQELDFRGLEVDVALRKFSSTLRMPGEAQKIERFVDRFASRYVECQLSPSLDQTQILRELKNSSPQDELTHLSSVDRARLFQDGSDETPGNNTMTGKNNLTMLSKDEIFILTFAIIMLNTDLHSPSLKSSTRMSANQFVNNLRGVFKSRTINEADLIEIYERVKSNQITTRPDHFTHVMKVQQGLTTNNFQKKEIPNLCVPHRRLVCYCRLFEIFDVTKKERIGQHQREIFLFNDILLVTKLARRARTNAPQQYTYRQHIPVQGLYVQLSQSVHYNYGIKLCRRTNNETVIMFNACNEFDQSRFVDDLNECIAVMDEMEHIRVNNIVDTIHLKQLERLRRHALLHEQEEKSSDDSDERAIVEDHVSDQENTSNYSSLNSSSVAGSLMALCTNPARTRCTATTAAPAPIVVEPLDKYLNK